MPARKQARGVEAPVSRSQVVSELTRVVPVPYGRR